MAIASSKCAKESKLEATARRWIAKPILGSDFTDCLPLEDVYVGLLKRKQDTSTAIQRVSSILPGFHHLKRCSSTKLLLAPLNLVEGEGNASEERTLSEDRLKTMLSEKGFDLSLLEDDFQIIKVPGRAARTKVQAAQASKIWPLNFHPDPNIECLIDGSIFTEHQLNLIERYMDIVVQAARLEAVGNSNCHGSAMIVDPEDGRILAVAASKIDQHPLWHAAMLVVDLVAKLQGGGAWKSVENFQEDSNESKASAFTDEKETEDNGSKEKRIKRKYIEEAPVYYPASLSDINLPKEESLKSVDVRRGRGNNNSAKTIESKSFEQTKATNSEKFGPYLCTGYWAFLLREPCPLCAMGLLHSRVSRIFYGAPNQSTGVLGSKTVLHAVPGLNHRYQVWGGVLEQECRQVLQEIEHRNMD